MGKSETLDGTFDDSAASSLVSIHNQYLELVESPQLMDPKQAALQIVQRILSADSLDSLKQIVASGTVDMASLVGKPFVIDSDMWYKSAPAYQENSAGVFVALTVKLQDTGETLVCTAGGENVVAIAYKLHTLGAIPTSDLWTFRDATTAAGFTTYWLVPYVAE